MGQHLHCVAALGFVLSLQGCRTADYRDTGQLDGDGASNSASCKLHGSALDNDTVRIIYGTPSTMMMEYYKSEAIDFPNAETFIGGGCIVSDSSPRRAKVLYCEQCREIERAWRQKYAWPVER